MPESIDRRSFVKLAGSLAAYCAASPAQALQSASGSLKVHPSNPRYFTDGSGRAVFLTGSNTWANLQDTGVAPVPVFDWEGYLAMMKSHNHNFMRLWGWQQSAWAPWTPDKILFEPVVYRRAGPGAALDGGAKFDLKKIQSGVFRPHARTAH